ncbi:unnamed protein product [Caenorhabditis angaria]|uniref:Uncharacterized protein n=1 Tax=Caenorhabditis angaria TaxID=860376 RepID=A0A9P1N9R5_9PELO|nr:unnamed protein product [Caenorhabditis angaria]CAI5456414.1 unnamed protein product [Caenorhabditis angaria]
MSTKKVLSNAAKEALHHADELEKEANRRRSLERKSKNSTPSYKEDRTQSCTTSRSNSRSHHSNSTSGGASGSSSSRSRSRRS